MRQAEQEVVKFKLTLVFLFVRENESRNQAKYYTYTFSIDWRIFQLKMKPIPPLNASRNDFKVKQSEAAGHVLRLSGEPLVSVALWKDSWMKLIRHPKQIMLFELKNCCRLLFYLFLGQSLVLVTEELASCCFARLSAMWFQFNIQSSHSRRPQPWCFVKGQCPQQIIKWRSKETLSNLTSW